MADGAVERDTPDAQVARPGVPLAPGRATPEGTARFAERHAAARTEGFYRTFDSSPHGASPTRSVSAIGAGSFLGAATDADDAEYTRAVDAAIRGGVNLIDTAINFRCQRSERVIGRVLAQLLASGVVHRDELVVSTKGGYLPMDGAPPATRNAYRAYVRQHWLDTGILTVEDVAGGAHAIAPAFLVDQIARSRANLGVATIDLYYLHNPEQQLEAVDSPTFTEKMRNAFECLESQVAAGTIASYGISTWHGVRVPPRSPGHLSLYDLVTLAREVAGDGHHLHTVQLPINFAMPDAVRLHTQHLRGRLRTALEVAEDVGLQVVASAPLNQGSLTSDLPAALRAHFPDHTTDAARALAFVTGLPGVCSAIVGARTVTHVAENLATFARL